MVSEIRTVLLLGGTGRTGRRVLEQLLDRGVAVRAVVRSPAKVPAESREHPGLELVHAQILALGDDELQRVVSGCGAVVSCLGHTVSLGGLFGPPRDLVTQATVRLCRAIEALRPPEPVRLVLMSSVSVNHPGGLDRRRGRFEKAALAAIRLAMPPAKDNQAAADFLHGTIGTEDRSVEWVAVRPDTLVEGDVSEYSLHDDLVTSIFRPRRATRANVAHFMCELVTDAAVWERWRGTLPALVDEKTE